MRDRNRILNNLETLYRSTFGEAESSGDVQRMSKLDFDFQRDQLLFEILLDIRDALLHGEAAEPESDTLLEKAQKLRRIAKLR